MRDNIHLVLRPAELFQILDGLEIRADAWRKTAAYFEDGDTGDDFFLIEECRDAAEAKAIARDYETIIAKLRLQQSTQAKIRRDPEPLPPPKSGTVTGYAVYINTLCQGEIPLERCGDLPICYATEQDAQLSIAESILDRLQQFLSGERDFEDATTIEEYVVPVDLHPDGSITDENGNTFPNNSW